MHSCGFSLFLLSSTPLEVLAKYNHKAMPHGEGKQSHATTERKKDKKMKSEKWQKLINQALAHTRMWLEPPQQAQDPHTILN